MTWYSVKFPLFPVGGGVGDAIDRCITHTDNSSVYIILCAGCMFILLAHPNSPESKTQLFYCFYLHEHGWPLNFPSTATDTLDTLGVEYTTEVIDGELDLTECFMDGFQKPHQRFLLDFVMHTKTERYPVEIFQLCVELLASAAIGKPDQYIIPFSVAFIVCKNKC